MYNSADIVSFLGRCELFKHASQQTIQNFASKVSFRKFGKSEIVLTKGQVNQNLYIVFSGIFWVSDSQRNLIQLKPGQLFGERSLLTDGQVQMELNCQEEGELMIADSSVFYDLLNTDNQFFKNLISILFDRVTYTNNEIVKSLEERQAFLEEEVKKRTHQLKQKNQEMLDSITYAKDLLENILPDLSAIKNEIDCFVFYRPKDIVAGDFYWYYKHQNDLYLLAGDCTGHGVPGAITSVICSFKLTEALEKGIYDPAQILSFVGRELKKAFRLNNQDGMEGILVKINKSKQELQFASAGRPLYHLYNGLLQDYFYPKTSLGHSAISEQEITTQTLLLNGKNSFFLCSDGYSDQFGGERTKKYSSKKFKTFLPGIANLKASTQETILEEEFLNWKGVQPQIDDVLVIGFNLNF